jgi:hypothetical protein
MHQILKQIMPIGINIIIMANDQEELNELNSGFNSLRDSVKGLSKEFPEFADSMQAGLIALSKELPGVVESMVKLNKANKELVANGEKPKSILSQLAGSMFSWNTALSIGTTLLITYSGEIIKWVKGLVTGETKISALTKALRDSKVISDSLIQTRLNGQKAAQSEITSLETLYRTSQQVTKDHKAQYDAANLLRAQWPERFKNIKNDILITGKASEEYKKLRGELVATAQAEAAKNTIAENSNRIAENNNKLQRENTVNKTLKRTEKDAKDYLKELTPPSDGVIIKDIVNFIASTPVKVIQARKDLDKAKTDREASDGIVAKIKDQNMSLNKVNIEQNNLIDDLVKQYGVAILNRNKQIKDAVEETKSTVTETNSGPFKTPKEHPTGPSEEQVQKESAERSALLILEGYAREIKETQQHFDKLIELHKGNKQTVEQLEKERALTLTNINQKFYDESLTELTGYENELKQTSLNAREEALQQLNADYEKKSTNLKQVITKNKDIVQNYKTEIEKLKEGTITQQTQVLIDQLTKKQTDAENLIIRAETVSKQLNNKHDKDTGKLSKSFADEDQKESIEGDIAKDQLDGNWQKEFKDRQLLLDKQYEQEINAEGLKEGAKLKIQKKYKDDTQQLNKSKQDAEAANQKKYLQSISSVANAVTGIFGKNTIAARLAFKAQQAAAAAQVIIETKKSIMNIWSANSGIPFVGVPKAIAETALVAAVGASNLASIIKQKPGFARGGQYTSDGRGALLPGYSRTDNTNAYLRSGEAVVVSEAMRNPWARNLVSAINVAHGGRDFSIPNPGRGYAIGGIFTDGGNANRYYSQPVNDQKDMANTLAYQMLNNFPPIYVDVKDVNNQQNILAQTVDRVNL